MYFSSFPVITYRNTQVRDITRSVTIPKSIRKIPTAFYPHEVENGQREDLLSKLVYDSEDFDWLIWLTNQIIDPYYGWYLTPEQFQNWMVEKYGSIETAQQKILYWRNNHDLDEFSISPSNYENVLTENQKRYWEPVFGAGIKISSYRRRPEDWTVSTNEIRKIFVSNSAIFSPADLVSVYDGFDRLGDFEVVSIKDPTTIIVKNPLGEMPDGVTLTSSVSGSSTSLTGYETIYLGLPVEERAYYSPVYAWDHYYLENEKNKQVLLLDPNYTGQAYLELGKDLNK